MAIAVIVAATFIASFPLAVIFDVVYHHAASSHNHYWQYDGNTTAIGGIYFEDPFRYEPARDEDGRSFAHRKYADVIYGI
jgi:hypothetical protein